MGKRGRTPRDRLAAGVGVDTPARESLSPTAVSPCEPDDIEGQLLRLFHDVRDELLSTLAYVLGNADDAQDAAQEAFLKCWRARNSMAEVVNLRAWIFRVGLNVAKDYKRSAWYRKSRPFPEKDSMFQPHTDAPGALLENQEIILRLRAAICHLRPEEQEVFLLRQNGGLTYEQIADIRNAPVGTIKTQMRAALQKLRRVLNPEHENDEGRQK